MRRFLILVVILVFAYTLHVHCMLFPLSGINQAFKYASQHQTPETHFREAMWGMTQAQIKALEKGAPKGTIHSKSSGLYVIAYDRKAGGLKCIAGYYFAEDQLVEGRYMFAEKHANDLLFFEDFYAVKAALTEKYGEPEVDKAIWLNDIFKSDTSRWGLALAAGHVMMEVAWNLPETAVLLRLLGDNYEVTHFVQYTSMIPKHQELTRKALEKAKKGIW